MGRRAVGNSSRAAGPAPLTPAASSIECAAASARGSVAADAVSAARWISCPGDAATLGPDRSGPSGQRAPDAPLRILIVSDVRFLRDGLSEVLPRQSGIAVVATAEDRDQAVQRAQALHPDAILLDTSLPDALSVVTTLAAAAPEIPVIALALTDAEQAVLEWAEAGMAGYVPRSASIADLITTTMLVVRGEQVCSTKIAGAMLRRLRQLATTMRQQRSTMATARLTPREREIAELLAAGLSNKLIARRLNIEVATAKCHVHNILDKLKLQRRGDLAQSALGNPQLRGPRFPPSTEAADKARA
jgi:DNA-binding NarL/FixJ family response regulator